MKTLQQFLKENRNLLVESKISGALYQKIERAIKDVLAKSNAKTFKDVENHYIKNKLGKDHKKRARWDLFWAIPQKTRDELNIYGSGANDDHLDTALKKITNIR
jgi:hypothetical protein